MKIERTRNAAKSIAAGVGLKLYQTVVPFLMRTVMLYYMGVEYLGLNSLFTSVVHILNLAELGVGAAMVFSMYKPIAEDDTPRICALMGLYRRYYRVIGLVIGVAGLVLTPFVPRLISGTVPPDVNVYWLYLLNLAGTVLTYWLFAYRNCLLQAHQRLDLASAITIAASTVQYALQLVIIICSRNYYLYVVVMLLGTVCNNILTAIVTKKRFSQYRPIGKLDEEETSAINRKIRDLFTSKLGSVLVTHADTVVISGFLGLSLLAVYQNYFFILSSIIAVMEILIGSITAGLGNSFITESREKNYADLRKFTFLFLWLTGVCVCCFLGLYQPFMTIWVGEELMLGFGMVICFALYFFVYTLYRLMNIYKDAAGLWRQDRFRPLASAAVNLALNLLSVKTFGLYGVLLSTVLSMLMVGMPWLLRNLFTLLFERCQLWPFLQQVLGQTLVVVLAGAAVCLLCGQITLSPWVTLAVRLMVCLAVPNVIFLLLWRRSAQFRPAVALLDRVTKGRLKLEKRLCR